MFPFVRKKEEPTLEEAKPVKAVRRRKKKEEPYKPWGKKERLVVFLFLILAPILSLLFLVHYNKEGTSKVLGSNNLKQPIDINILKNQLANEVQNLSGTYGIWFQTLDSNYSFGINENDQFDGASLFKLPLMFVYYEKVDSGSINPSTTYTLKYSDASAGSGALASMQPGTQLTYRDVIRAMGENSDNTGFSIMQNVLGIDSEVSVINQIGMKNTLFSESITTPFDIGLLFDKLNSGNLISNSSKNELISFLTNNDHSNLISAGVPATVSVIHKYGVDDGELNDAGIVFAAKPYILIILSKNVNQPQAQGEIAKLSKLVYDFLSK